MAEEAAALKGNVTFEADEKKLEGKLVFEPDPEGEEWDEAKILRLLRQAGLQEQVEQGRIRQALKTFQDKADEKIEVAVVTGTPPEASTDETLEWTEWEIPEELRAAAEECLSTAGDPVVYDIQVDRVKVQEKVQTKAVLPFLKPKVETVTKWKKQESRKAVAVTNTPRAIGYFEEGAVIGSLEFGKVGRPGRDIFGRPVAPEKPAKVTLYLGEGVRRRGAEIRADKPGLARRGDDWVDLIPFKAHQWRVFASEDRGACLLDFSPGIGDRPSAAEVLKQAEEIGFPPSKMLEVERIDGLLEEAVVQSRSLQGEVINASRDGSFDITVSPDRLKATLNLQKHRGKGKPLSLKEVGQAIVSHGFKGMDTARVKADILAFMKGEESDLPDYLLVEGKPPSRGKDAEVAFDIAFLSSEEAQQLLGKDECERAASAVSDANAAGIRLAYVKEGDDIAQITLPTKGSAGLDVYGKALPGLEGAAPALELSGGLEQKDNRLLARKEGLLEIRRREGISYARVRAHREGRVAVRISDDKMQAFISLQAAKGGAETVTADQISNAMAEEGVVKGINSVLLLKLVKQAQAAVDIPETLIAEGLPPRKGSGSRLQFHVPISSGRALFVVPQKERKEKDAVGKGSLLAEILPPTIPSRNGWAVMGNAVPARPPPGLDIEVGGNVRREVAEDGVLRLIAEKAGEVFYDGNLLDIKDSLIVRENVTPKRGEIEFSGSVTINGSVEEGCRVFAGGDIVVNGSVTASVLSSGGSIIIRNGVLGNGKAIVRAKGDVRSGFLNDTMVLAVGSVQVKSSCLRCKVRCNSRLILDQGEGNLAGGNIRAKKGIETGSLGSDRQVHTEISFGQDYLVADQIELEEREVEKLKKRIAQLDKAMQQWEKDRTSQKDHIDKARAEKWKSLRILEKRQLRLLNLRERFEEHFPSEIKVHGELYPGVVLESHGRIHEIKEEKRNVIIGFDVETGKISERSG